MKTHTYTFTEDELLLLREAMADLKHRLQPEVGASEARLKHWRLADALLQDFKDDLRRG